MKQALTGGAYTAHSVIASAQRCVNLFPEPGPRTATSTGSHVSDTGEPSTTAHYPTPGLRLLGTIGTGPIRGIRQCTTGGVYVVSGSTLYSVDTSAWTSAALGTLTPGLKTPVSMQDNGLDMLVVDGTANGWVVNLAANTMAAINDPNGMFTGADKVDYLDTFFILNKPGTPQFYISGSLALTFDPLDFANKEAYSDHLVTVAVTHRILYLFGERTSEVWYDAGLSGFSTTDPTVATSFQFAPMQSLVFIDHGCAAKYSPATDHNRVFWLTKDRRGQGVVMMAEGETTTRVSTFAIEAEIAEYTRISDAIGFTYQIVGHSFYVLTFPHADKTWSYDITTGLWHQWAWIDSNGDEHRHRANCYWAVNDLGVVGDWQNGNLYALDQRVFTDNGQPIKRVRAFPHILNDGKRVFYRQFLADMETGWAPETSILIPPVPGVSAGFRALPRMAGGGNNGVVDAVSADGHTASGWVSPASDDSFQIACYWTSASGGWADARGPFAITNPDPDVGEYSEAFGVSGDGSIVVGSVQKPSPIGFQPFRWTAAAGLVLMADTSVTGLARAISADGSRIVGYVTDLITGSHQACYWDGVSLVRTNLGFLSGDTVSEALAISADGTFIVGHGSVRAWRWSAATGMVDLGFPGGVGATSATATGVSDDGNLVAGTYGTSSVGGSWQWTPTGGMVVIPMPAVSFQGSVSGDGSTILGADPTGQYMAYMPDLGAVVVPPAVPLDPIAYPGFSQPTQGLGISADGMTIVGSTLLGADPHHVPYAYRVPNPSGPGTPSVVLDTLISLRWSDDRGHSWGSPVTQSIGAAGAYRTSLQWQRLAYARDRCFELSWSVPMRTALQGCWLDVTPAQS